MKFIKNIWNKVSSAGTLFGSTPGEITSLLCGIGESKINDKSISIWAYPFAPASVFPEKTIHLNEISEVHLNEYPPTLLVDKELVFISREHIDLLTDFAKRNHIKVAQRASNWSWITEPFLDTEFSKEQQERTIQLLLDNGFSRSEISKLRNEIGKQMYKYNFDTMLWEWGNLGLNDVLAAMRPKLKNEEFKDFYWRAMDIELRE